MKKSSVWPGFRKVFKQCTIRILQINMFSATLNDTKAFRDAIETIAQIIDEGLFKIKKTGIELLATDRAMVALVDFKISSSAFSSYECTEETTAGLNLLNFLTILKRIGPEDKMGIRLNLEEQKLEIILEGKSVRRFAVPLLEISQEEVSQIAALEFPASVEIKSDIVEQGISDADIIADSVLIGLSPEQIIMKAEGDGNKMELTLPKGHDIISMSVNSAVRSRYPLEYLKKIIKAAKLSDSVKIMMGSDYPVKMEFKGRDIYLSFVVAPRVSDE